MRLYECAALINQFPCEDRGTQAQCCSLFDIVQLCIKNVAGLATNDKLHTYFDNAIGGKSQYQCKITFKLQAKEMMTVAF